MAAQPKPNLYPGINAHLNSFLQQPDGGWESFHAEHVIQIRQALDDSLLPNYYAITEKSLQIGIVEQDPEAAFIRQQRYPDISVQQLQPSSQTTTPTATASAPTATLPLSEVLLEEEHDIMRVTIYHIEGRLPGKPIAWIEVLSPANKPGSPHYSRYMDKRTQALIAGIVLMEIDYLHQTPPIWGGLPSYPHGDDSAFPYWVILSDPRPKTEEGRVEIYGFGVDDPLPRIRIPLVGNDSVVLDLGAVYNQTYKSVRIFNLLVDYAQTPINFEAYSEADRALILKRLETIRQWSK